MHPLSYRLYGPKQRRLLADCNGYFESNPIGLLFHSTKILSYFCKQQCITFVTEKRKTTNILKKEEQPKRFQLTPEELENLRDKVTDNPGLLSYPHHAGSALVKPEDKGKIKGLAMAAMEEQTHMQLKQIYDQVQVLLNQAKAIKDRVTISERIYMAKMGFKPLISHTYYLYQNKNGEDVLSMVAPSEWGKTMPFSAYLAKVRLLSDHTWEIMESQEENF